MAWTLPDDHKMLMKDPVDVSPAVSHILHSQTLKVSWRIYQLKLLCLIPFIVCSKAEGPDRPLC